MHKWRICPFCGRRKEEDEIPTPHTEFGEIRTILIDNEPWFVYQIFVKF